MFIILHLLATFIADRFKPRRQLEVENLFLRHQLNIAYGQKTHLRHSCYLLMIVITQEAAQSLAASNRTVTADLCTPRKQQDVVLPLMIAFGMVMLDVFAQRSPQRALAEQHHLGQALLFHGPDPAFRMGIQVRAPGRQHQCSTRPEAMIARNDWVYLLSRSCSR